MRLEKKQIGASYIIHNEQLKSKHDIKKDIKSHLKRGVMTKFIEEMDDDKEYTLSGTYSERFVMWGYDSSKWWDENKKDLQITFTLTYHEVPSYNTRSY